MEGHSRKIYNMKNRLLLLIIFSLNITNIYSQNDAFTNEITRKGNKVYFNGKPLSGWLFSEEDGIPNQCDCLLKARYKNGYLNGTKQVFYSSGKPKEKSVYVNGVIKSKILYYPNGKKKKEEKYKQGTLISSTLYNRDGTIKGQTNNNSEVNQNTQVNQVATDKPVKSTVLVKNNTSQTSGGLQKVYYPNGKPKQISLYKNGLLVKDSLFFEEGKIQIVKKYSDGELTHLEEYYKNGGLKYEKNFLNNKKNGQQKEFQENGYPVLMEDYENGELLHREEYNKEGTPVSEVNYKYGKKDGPQIIYDKIGKPLSVEEYKLGILIKSEKITKTGKETIHIQNKIKEIKKYNKQNKLILSGYELGDGTKDSVWIKYDSITGNKLSEIAYKKGRKIREGTYKNNQPDGKWHFYQSNKVKETLKTYKEGKLLDSKIITYTKQIKNNLLDNDLIFSYKLPLKNNNGQKYILARVQTKDTNDVNTKQLKSTIINAVKKTLIPVKNLDSIQDEELSKVLIFEQVKYRFVPKNKSGNRFIAQTFTKLKVKDYDKDILTENNLAGIPVPENGRNINDYYTSDKDKAFNQSLTNLSKKIQDKLHQYFPLKARVVKATLRSNKRVDKIILTVVIPVNFMPNQYWAFKDKGKNTKAKAKVVSMQNGLTLFKVVEGGEWLKDFLTNNKEDLIEISKTHK